MSAHAGAVPVQTAIDRIGFGRFQKRLLGVCGVTWAADAAEIFLHRLRVADDHRGLRAHHVPELGRRRLDLRRHARRRLVLGHRRRTASAASAASRSRSGSSRSSASCRPSRPTCGLLCLFRVLAGFGLGGAVPLDFSLFAEYLPTRNRGRWLVILESFWGVGTVVAAALAWILVPTLGWRSLLATSAIAGALVFWVRLRVPESPRYLAATGRVDEAEAILGHVARENGVPERDVPRIVPPADASDKVERQAPVRGPARAHHGDAVEHLVLHRARLLRPVQLDAEDLRRARSRRRPDLRLRAAARRGAAARATSRPPGSSSAGAASGRSSPTCRSRRCARSSTARREPHGAAGGRRAHELLRARRVGEPLRVHARAAADARCAPPAWARRAAWPAWPACSRRCSAAC